MLQEKIGGVLGFDAVQTKLVWESALKGLIDAFAPASGLRGISRNRTDAQFCEGAADLGQMAFLDWAACLGSEEEMSGPVRIQGAEDPVRGNAIAQKEHAG